MILKQYEEDINKKSLNDLLSSKNKKVKFVGVLLPIELYIELEKIAREEERAISQIVRLAIRRYLKEKRNAEVKK